MVSNGLLVKQQAGLLDLSLVASDPQQIWCYTWAAEQGFTSILFPRGRPKTSHRGCKEFYW